MIINNENELEAMRISGAKLRYVIDEVEKAVKPGVSTRELNDLTLKLIKEQGAKPSFLNYTPYGANRPYPAALCASVNEVVVHGIPNERDIILKEGDIVTIDTGLSYNGYFTDTAKTVAVGSVSDKLQTLIKAAKEARDAQINTLKAGVRTGDLGFAVEQVCKKYGFDSPEYLGGHGLGRAVHEEPFVPNFGQKGKGYKFKEGEIVALEPIVIAGSGDVYLADDGYSYITKDGSFSAQFEHTVVVKKDGVEILT